jgi:hypothetical protein
MNRGESHDHDHFATLGTHNYNARQSFIQKIYNAQAHHHINQILTTQSPIQTSSYPNYATMAPKQSSLRVSQGRVAGKPGSKGYFGEAYSAITSPENASVVRSVAIFGVSLILSISVNGEGG